MATNTPLKTKAPADWSGIDLTGVRLILDQPPDKAVFDTIIQRAAATAKKVAAESALPFDKLLRLKHYLYRHKHFYNLTPIQQNQKLLNYLLEWEN